MISKSAALSRSAPRAPKARRSSSTQVRPPDGGTARQCRERAQAARAVPRDQPACLGARDVPPRRVGRAPAHARAGPARAHPSEMRPPSKRGGNDNLNPVACTRHSRDETRAPRDSLGGGQSKTTTAVIVAPADIARWWSLPRTTTSVIVPPQIPRDPYARPMMPQQHSDPLPAPASAHVHAPRILRFRPR